MHVPIALQSLGCSIIWQGASFASIFILISTALVESSIFQYSQARIIYQVIEFHISGG